MLVLTRKASQQVMIGTEIRITVVRTDRNRVRLGIEAPVGLSVLRGELAMDPSSAEPPPPGQRPGPSSSSRGHRGPRRGE